MVNENVQHLRVGELDQHVLDGGVWRRRIQASTWRPRQAHPPKTWQGHTTPYSDWLRSYQRDVLLIQSLSMVLKKLNLTHLIKSLLTYLQQKQYFSTK